MRKLRTEGEIISNWHGDIDKPLVSICCIAYNHEKYIEDALEGFLIQETSFPFEVIIHDDASTDLTAEIIRQYVEKYPRIVKPIYQELNQYSVSPNKPGLIALDACKGAYIALCEGDDYWTASNKLQKQFNFMDSHENYSACAHKVQITFEGVEEIRQFFPQPAIDPELDEFLNSTRYIALVSIFARAKFLKRLPSWFGSFPGGHMIVLIHLRLKGRIYFFSEDIMGVHRKNMGGITYNPDKRYDVKNLVSTLNYSSRNWIHINRFRISYFENFLIEAESVHKYDIAKLLIRLYSRAIFKELLNLNFNRGLMYLFKMKVLRKNMKFFIKK